MQHQESSKILVTDFDGTITQRDFYSCVVEKLLGEEDLQPWNDYIAGEITHFEALRRIFLRIRGDESEMDAVFQMMEFDSAFPQAVKRLQNADWSVVIVSNGCAWYIHRFLNAAGVQLELHTNPGDYSPEHGLRMESPIGSPYYSEEMGIDKRLVVAQALSQTSHVAFAGDGRPDAEAASLVRPQLLFARGWLSSHLEENGCAYHSFSVWSEIAQKLLADQNEL